MQGYGMTEAGVLMGGDPRENWKYMRIMPNSGATMVPEEGQDNVYELVVINGGGAFSGYLNNVEATEVKRIKKSVCFPPF